MLLSGYVYTCGALVTPPKYDLHGKVVTRKNITCAPPVEIPYYGTDFGRNDICCHCDNEEGETNLHLKGSFQTALPMCMDCENVGKEPVMQRHFGFVCLILFFTSTQQSISYAGRFFLGLTSTKLG